MEHHRASHENHQIGDHGRAQTLPEMQSAFLMRKVFIAPGTRKLGFTLLIGGLSGQVADHFSNETFARDRKRCRQNKIGVVFLLCAHVVLQMITAIGVRARQQRIGTEKIAEYFVKFAMRAQRVMRRIMHQNSQTQLARADNHHGQHKSQRVWKEIEQRHGAADNGPGVKNQ